ncbi:MAG: winged helix-turn-helix transcriptional regulator [Desulfomonile tiedjei]|nr:winged helix-turn-helix transcriptional regulator [Desulfomonile tiedjei]
MNDPETRDLIQTMAHECIAVRVRLINRLVTAVYDEALRGVGIKASQMNILVAVSMFGPSKPAKICSLLRLDPSTLSRNVERMKKKGWLEAVPGADARSHLLAVLAPGNAILRDAYPAWREAQKKAAAILGGEALDALLARGSRLLNEGLSPDEP